MTTKKKTDKKAGSDPETESDAENDHENGEEHQGVESDAQVKRGGGIANPWNPGPGRARTD